MIADLVQQGSRLQDVQTFLRYVLAAGQYITEEEVREIVIGRLSQRGGAIMGTIAEKWIEQGRQQGEQIALRSSILKILQIHFTISTTETDRLTRRLAEVTDSTRLESLHEHALRAASLAEFETHLT